mmetsp:Transcript_109045/g.184925  ORF Transcript_109045/g.184925 Transcript_109045/m.184925 type:complete len:351 (-) Transcript_109045:669-1721(-)
MPLIRIRKMCIALDVSREVTRGKSTAEDRCTTPSLKTFRSIWLLLLPFSSHELLHLGNAILRLLVSALHGLLFGLHLREDLGTLLFGVTRAQDGVPLHHQMCLHHIVHGLSVGVRDDLTVIQAVEQESDGLGLLGGQLRVPHPQDQDVPVLFRFVERLVQVGSVHQDDLPFLPDVFLVPHIDPGLLALGDLQAQMRRQHEIGVVGVGLDHGTGRHLGEECLHDRGPGGPQQAARVGEQPRVGLVPVAAVAQPQGLPVLPVGPGRHVLRPAPRHRAPAAQLVLTERDHLLQLLHHVLPSLLQLRSPRVLGRGVLPDGPRGQPLHVRRGLLLHEGVVAVDLRELFPGFGLPE